MVPYEKRDSLRRTAIRFGPYCLNSAAAFSTASGFSGGLDPANPCWSGGGLADGPQGRRGWLQLSAMPAATMSSERPLLTRFAVTHPKGPRRTNLGVAPLPVTYAQSVSVASLPLWECLPAVPQRSAA